MSNFARQLSLCTVIRRLRLPENVEQTLKILVMMPQQLASELASEAESEPANNTLDAGMGMWVNLRLTTCEGRLPCFLTGS